MSKVKVKFGYCDYCQKEIEEPSRKPLDEMQKTIVAIVFISTIGVAILISLVLIISLNPMSIVATLTTLGITLLIYEIYTKLLRRAIYCPTCESKLQFSKEAFIKPLTEKESKTAKERILVKVEEKKKKKEKHHKVK